MTGSDRLFRNTVLEGIDAETIHVCLVSAFLFTDFAKIRNLV